MFMSHEWSHWSELQRIGTKLKSFKLINWKLKNKAMNHIVKCCFSFFFFLKKTKSWIVQCLSIIHKPTLLINVIYCVTFTTKLNHHVRRGSNCFSLFRWKCRTHVFNTPQCLMFSRWSCLMTHVAPGSMWKKIITGAAHRIVINSCHVFNFDVFFFLLKFCFVVGQQLT